jgi:hypothetical protein
MARLIFISLSLALCLLECPGTPSLKAAPPNHERMVWNYDGGLELLTDGSIPSGPCFRIVGRVTAPNYFDNLKRIDTDTTSIIRRGKDIVTEFPAMLHLTFLMHDFPCDTQLENADAGNHMYLTKAMVSRLRLSFYWKRGLSMRPAAGIVPGHYETRRIVPYAVNLSADLPERYEWEFEFDLPSAGVPVTDSLVLVVLDTSGHIVARGAARM